MKFKNNTHQSVMIDNTEYKHGSIFECNDLELISNFNPYHYILINDLEDGNKTKKDKK